MSHDTDPAPFHDTDPAPYDDTETLARAIRLLAPSSSCGPDLNERGERWVRLRELAAELAVLIDEYTVDLGNNLEHETYDRREGWELPDGTRVVHRHPATERWEGRKLLRTLATETIDPDTGETSFTVPLSVLVDILPGVATDDATSSRWKLAGLRNQDINIDDYRHLDYKPARADVWRPR